jgi:hypothetical protein
MDLGCRTYVTVPLPPSTVTIPGVPHIGRWGTLVVISDNAGIQCPVC